MGKQIRIHAAGACFAPYHHSGAVAVLADLRGVVILCHPVQVLTVTFALKEHQFILPVVGDFTVDPSHVKYFDVVTGGVEYMVEGLAIPAVQGQIEEQLKGGRYAG